MLRMLLNKNSLSRLVRTYKQSGLKMFRSIGRGDYLLRSHEIVKLLILPNNAIATVKLGQHSLKMCNPKWFLFNYREIFDEEIYLFNCEKESPYIIDCGSNIGLSILYLKKQFPGARIVGFEPDPLIFDILQENVSNFELSSITLENKAVWNENDLRLGFRPEIGLGGKLDLTSDLSDRLVVKSVRLKDYLSEPIDFLKIDIEGAEVVVLEDIKEDLHWVEKIFVEYHGEKNRPQELQLLLDILSQTGFRYYIKDAYPVLHPYIESEHRSGFDLQLNIFAFRWSL